jgi:hypothetical protein
LVEIGAARVRAILRLQVIDRDGESVRAADAPERLRERRAMAAAEGDGGGAPDRLDRAAVV